MAGPLVMTVTESRIDHETAAGFQDDLLAVVGDGSETVIIDLASVESISSVGLRALVVAAKKSKPAVARARSEKSKAADAEPLAHAAATE